MRIVQNITLGLAIALLLFMGADLALWHRAVQAGKGIDTVQVSSVSVASLKGSKEEYYADGSVAVQCSRSVLPMPATEGWFPPCWWQRRHRTVQVHY